MNTEQAGHALHHLFNNGLVLPFSVFPTDAHIFESEANWSAYHWNPPNNNTEDFPIADLTASPKPTWQELLTAAGLGEVYYKKEVLLNDLKRICRNRITLAYGQDNHHDEIELRLGGRHTEAQDTERDRLRSRYSIIKAWIESTDRTLAELEALDLTDDANWTGETWPPVRGGL